jgi:dissimilatory sulfite reductase (desulfoviridin) alpha/beta subunit
MGVGMENINYEDLKKRGFLKQKQEGFFVLRTRMAGGIYKKEHLEKLSQVAQKYGQGFAHATVRQGMEIPFIKFEDIPKIEEELKSACILTGTSGARLRTIVTCPGNNWCKVGLIDPFSLAVRLEKEHSLVCGMDLPHKFKIAISGCPNSCTRTQASDIGIHGALDVLNKRAGYVVYLGGYGGRASKDGFKLERVFSEDEVLLFVASVVAIYKERAKPRQRLGALIEEIGKDNFLGILKKGGV